MAVDAAGGDGTQVVVVGIGGGNEAAREVVGERCGVELRGWPAVDSQWPDPEHGPMEVRPVLRLLSRLAPALAIAAALSGGSASPVVADHGGQPLGSLLDCDRPVTPPRCVSVGDDFRHHVFIHPSVPRALADSVRRAMREAYGPTALRMIEQRRINRFTDLIVYAADHGENGAAGWVNCPPDAPQGVNVDGNRWCRHQELHFNLNARYAAFFADDDSRTHLACHEIGHSVGLRHWGNPPITDGPTAATCMNADTPNGPVGLHRFDRAHINAYYARPGDRVAKRCMSEL